MEPLQHLTRAEIFVHAIKDLANAISERFGETKEQHLIRAQVATHLILGLAPRDMIEMMLAGHAVMFHALMTDGIREALQRETNTVRRGAGPNVVTLNRAFHLNLDKLIKYQTRPSEDGSVAGKPDVPAERARPVEARRKEAADERMPRPAPSRAAEDPTRAALTPISMWPVAPQVADNPFQAGPSLEQTAGCLAHSDFGAAIGAGALEFSPRVGGIDQPAEPALAAADASPSAPPRLNRAQRRQRGHGRVAP